jgi:nucleotide-binding universal stress UspA family protein
MYSRLLITLDGSELSESILPCARILAKKLDLPVVLLRVVEREVIAVAVNPKRNYSHSDAEQDLRTSSNNYLNGIVKSFPGVSKANCFTLVGDPAEVIIEKASEEEGTLLAMSTHGRSGIQRWYLGSVADKVLHASKSPMLLVKGKEHTEAGEREATINRIIVPLDGSPLAEQALPHATAVATALDAEIGLLEVYSLVTNAYYGEGFMPNFEEIADAMREEVKAYLTTKIADLDAAGVRHGDGIIEEGDAAAKIIELAQKTPNSLITMCSHGRSGISRWVLGGTADRVVRHSGDPVLIVRAAE